MKLFPIVTLLLLLCAFLWIACDNKIEFDACYLDFDATDKESNKIGLSIRSHYNLSAGRLRKLHEQFGSHYKDSMLIPVVISISQNTLKEYSAGDIYNYKRQEIEQKLAEQTKIAFASHDIELTDFFLVSVQLSDKLMRRLEKEHLRRHSEK